MSEEVLGQVAELDGEDDDDDGADDVEGDGPSAERRVELLHRREGVPEVGARNVRLFGHSLLHSAAAFVLSRNRPL